MKFLLLFLGGHCSLSRVMRFHLNSLSLCALVCSIVKYLVTVIFTLNPYVSVYTMDTDQQQFCLRWHSYQSSLMATLPQLLDGNHLTDVTLSAQGRNLRAHKVILSACSHYFKELFKVISVIESFENNSLQLTH